ncbi:MAG TPA: DUF2306 domain-containing protein [Gammaproteobacteria bacterium]
MTVDILVPSRPESAGAGIASSNVKFNAAADSVLKTAARFWFLTALAGQWIFVYYIAIFYGSLLLGKGLEGLKETHLPNGFVPGDTLGNLAVATHVLLAAIVMGGGPLQLIPQIRAWFPAFHRWNGRLYMLTVFILSLGGLYAIWTRGSISGRLGDIAISLNAVLILLFAVLALRAAIARDIKTHRRWALRLFLVASGVWFFRVGLMLWVFIHKAPVGFDPETFRGPFLTFLGFAQYLLPLAVLEIYFWALDRAGALGKSVTAGGVFVLTVAMGVGIFTATMGMWLPRL